MNNELLKEIAFQYREDILEPYGDMMEQIGFEALCVLSDQYGGAAFYIPTKKKIFFKCIEKQVEKEFQGDYKSLSRKYEICDRTIRNIMARRRLGKGY